MFTARRVILLTIAIAVLSTVGSLLSLLQSLDRGGKGDDSYGTQARGYRALYEILGELHVPVERGLAPPTSYIDRAVTLVFWGSYPAHVRIEPAYLQKVAAWVKAGGLAVIAPGRGGSLLGLAMSRTQGDVSANTILEEFGLDVWVEQVNLSGTKKGSESAAGAASRPAAGRPMTPDELAAALSGRSVLIPPRELGVVRIEATGSLERLAGSVHALQIPKTDLQVVDVSDVRPLGTIRCRTADGEVQTLVAHLQHGQGEVLVISEPALFENLSIARSDNVLLASQLLAAPGRPVVFDEFYHGLAVRGNPLWLLTRWTYALLAGTILAAVGLWIWRQARFLGPPVEAAPASRRTLAEYVDAMSRFLVRGRGSGLFLLREVRSGVLWSLRRELGLSPGRETLEAVAATLARRDPPRAQQLVGAITAADRLLDRGERVSEHEIVQALQRISACL
jgi:hypothetical protein